jgi:hypothetical protein
MKPTVALPFVVLVLLAGCDEPAEPDTPDIDVAYLLDRVNGNAPPEPICEQGSVDQSLEFESIALRVDQTYGRAQVIRLGDDPPIEQRETGDFERTADEILLINAADDTLVLALLDSAGEHVRRIHPCGDTLRYASTPVED